MDGVFQHGTTGSQYQRSYFKQDPTHNIPIGNFKNNIGLKQFTCNSHRGYGIFSDYPMMLLFTCACVEGHIRVGRHLEKE